MKLDVMRARRQHKFMAGGLPGSSHRDIFDENNGLSSLKGQVGQVQHGQSLHGSDPELAVGSEGHVGSADAALCRGHAISLAEPCVIARVIRVSLVLSDSLCRKAQDAL